jgi:hypothetical protein
MRQEFLARKYDLPAGIRVDRHGDIVALVGGKRARHGGKRRCERNDRYGSV